MGYLAIGSNRYKYEYGIVDSDNKFSMLVIGVGGGESVALYYHPGLGSGQSVLLHAAKAAMAAYSGLSKAGFGRALELLKFNIAADQFIKSYMDLGHDVEGYYANNSGRDVLIVRGRLTEADIRP